jgi:hypothetical protein
MVFQVFFTSLCKIQVLIGLKFVLTDCIDEDNAENECKFLVQEPESLKER